MDFTSLSAIFGALAGGATTVWTVLDGRGPLRRLERVTAILKDMPDDAPGRPPILLIQENLAKRINITYRAPRYASYAALAWVARLAGGILVGVGYVSFVAAAVLAGTDLAAFWSADGFRGGLQYSGIGIFFILSAEGLLHLRRRARDKWITANADAEVFNSYL